MDPKTHEINAIVGRSLIAATSLADELIGDLIDATTSIRAGELLGRVGRVQLLLDRWEPVQAQLLVDSEMAANVAGANALYRRLPSVTVEALAGGVRAAPDWPSLVGGDLGPVVRFPAIERAAENLMRRSVVTRDEFDELEGEARRRAFTMTGETSRDALGTIRDTLAESVEKGWSLESFRENLDEDLSTSFLGQGHQENVFRTNTSAAYHAAHDTLADDPVVSELFPYQAYIPVGDTRTRPTHFSLGKLGLSGTGIYRRDDPMWDIFTPPWDYQCRCGVNLLTIEAAARLGVEEARRWQRTGQPPEQPEWRLEAIPFRPENDFVSGRRAA